MSKRHGYLPDTHDTSGDPAIRHLLGARARLPPEASLEAEAGRVGVDDQGETNSCVAFALSLGAAVRCMRMGAPIARPSRLGIYALARALDRRARGKLPPGAELPPAPAAGEPALPPAADPREPLTDDGCQPLYALQGMQDPDWGVVAEADWPFDPARVNDEPTLGELEPVLQLQGAYRILSEGADRLADVRQACAAGYPVFVGKSVDQAFDDYKGGRPLGASDPKQIVGGHATLVVGYSADGRFRGANSYGRGWGDDGLFWCDPTWLTDPCTFDLIVLAVAPTHYGVIAA